MTTFESISDEKRFGGIVDEPKAKYVLDCAFAYITSKLEDVEIEPRMPTASPRTPVGCSA